MIDKDQAWELFAWAAIIGLLLLAFSSAGCTTADAVPDSFMVGVPFNGNMENAYWYLSWSIPQPSEGAPVQ